MLAYSSIAHGGYLLVGLVAANEVGKAAILFYLLAYAVTNLAAFGVIALLGSRERGNDELRDYAGLWHSHPALAALMTVVPAVARRPAADGRLHRQVVHLQRRGQRRLLRAGHHRRADQRRLGLLLPARRRDDVHVRARRRAPCRRRSAAWAWPRSRWRSSPSSTSASCRRRSSTSPPSRSRRSSSSTGRTVRPPTPMVQPADRANQIHRDARPDAASASARAPRTATSRSVQRTIDSGHGYQLAAVARSGAAVAVAVAIGPSRCSTAAASLYADDSRRPASVCSGRRRDSRRAASSGCRRRRQRRGCGPSCTLGFVVVEHSSCGAIESTSGRDLARSRAGYRPAHPRSSTGPAGGRDADTGPVGLAAGPIDQADRRHVHARSTVAQARAAGSIRRDASAWSAPNRSIVCVSFGRAQNGRLLAPSMFWTRLG